MRDTCALKRNYVWIMARQVSDRATADNLRAEAARYHAEAAEIETGVKTPVIKAAPEQD